MPLTKKGKKIKKSFDKQYGKDADKVFYASINKGTLKGVEKAAKGGGVDYSSQDLEEQAAIDRGEPTAQMTTQERDDQGYGSGPTTTYGTKPDKPTLKQRAVTTGQNLAGQYLTNKVFGVPGIMYDFAVKPLAKKMMDMNKKREKQVVAKTVKTPTTKPPIPPTTDNDGGGVQPILKKKPIIQTAKVQKPVFDAKSFFPFRTLRDGGGVKSGPPPKSGPNSQIPPIKMRNGKMTKTYKFSCPSRPDGIRGMGKALRGHKFTGVK